VLVLAQKVFWPAFTFISGFGQFVDGGMVAIYWYVYVCACVRVCVCAPTWLWVVATPVHLSNGDWDRCCR